MGCFSCISIKIELTHFRDRHNSEQTEAQEDTATAQEAGIEDREQKKQNKWGRDFKSGFTLG